MSPRELLNLLKRNQLDSMGFWEGNMNGDDLKPMSPWVVVAILVVCVVNLLFNLGELI